jgi:hypothetical protein
MMDCMLGEGLDVVRGDVQTRLFGGAEEEVGRLLRFSDVVMIFCRLMDATETGGGDLRLSMKGAGAEQEGCTRAGSCKIETPETLKVGRTGGSWLGATADRHWGILWPCIHQRPGDHQIRL